MSKVSREVFVTVQKSLVEIIITGLVREVVLWKIGKVVFISAHMSRHHTYESLEGLLRASCEHLIDRHWAGELVLYEAHGVSQLGWVRIGVRRRSANLDVEYLYQHRSLVRSNLPAPIFLIIIVAECPVKDLRFVVCLSWDRVCQRED